MKYLFTCSNLDAHSRKHNNFTEVVVYIYFVPWMVGLHSYKQGRIQDCFPGVGPTVTLSQWPGEGVSACGIILLKIVDAVLEDVSVAEIIV